MTLDDDNSLTPPPLSRFSPTPTRALVPSRKQICLQAASDSLTHRCRTPADSVHLSPTYDSQAAPYRYRTVYPQARYPRRSPGAARQCTAGYGIGRFASRKVLFLQENFIDSFCSPCPTEKTTVGAAWENFSLPLSTR